jgi:hypothetical protein
MRAFLLAICLLFVSAFGMAQTLEDFETQPLDNGIFLSNSQVFTIDDPTTIALGRYRVTKTNNGEGWNGTGVDNLYIGCNGKPLGEIVKPLIIKTSDGAAFHLKSMYLFLSTEYTTFNIGSSTCTVTGKLAGVTQFTATKSSGFATSYATNNGFTFFDMSTLGGANNSTTSIDEFVITVTGDIGYIALDAMKWQSAAACPAVTVTAGSQSNVSCNGGNNGTASISASGGTGFTYNWTPGNPTGDGTASVSNLAAGVYTCTVTNSCGNTGSVSITITSPPLLTVSATTTNTTCNGGANGTATATVTGGTAPYNYSWSPTGGTGATATGLAAGAYSFSVTDSKGCAITLTNLVVSQPAAIAASIAGTDVSCNGGTNGSATVSGVTGGTGAYTYSWSPSGGTGATANGLMPGTYTCTITDANGCFTTKSVTINQPSAMTATTSFTDALCNTPGQASITVSNGTAPYTYSWSPTGGSGATATGLAAGSYTVTATDNKGCVLTRNITIANTVSTLSADIAGTDVSCNNGANGTATISNVSGGTAPYTYSWSPTGGSAATANGLMAGTYTCTITDANGCFTTRSVTITQPLALGAFTTQQNAVCNTPGRASITMSGGTAPYTYSWAPSGGTAATATGLTAGNYVVTVTDNKGCILTRNFTIANTVNTLSTTIAGTNVSCNGGSDGTATIRNLTVGTGPYTYSWSPTGGTSPTASGLMAGTYTCTITDANGCFTTRSVTVTQPTAMAATTSFTDVLCNTPGQASITMSGGTAPYTYSWSPTGGSAASATGLAAGNYVVTVTDNKGCELTRNFTIANTVSTISSTIAGTNVSCNGGSNGAATISGVTGGTGPYTYSWAPTGGTGATANGLMPGTYTCTITDANGCIATNSVTITQPAALTATVTPTDATCNSDGGAAVTVNGGTAPYTYAWSPTGGNAATATGLTPGSYSVTATDDMGCSITKTFTITRVNNLTATTSQTDVTCHGGANGTATVTPSNGTIPYTYSWAPTGGSAATASGLIAGTYTCTISEANGCSITKTVTITEPATIPVSAVAGPANGTYTEGNNLDFTVSFPQTVTVTGIPYLSVTLNTGGAVHASYHSTTGGNTLVFRYTITATDQDPDGVSLGTHITLNGGSIQNASGCNTLLVLNAVPSTTGVLVKNRVPQTITFNSLPTKTYGDANFAAGSTASSGLPVTYNSSNTAVAIVTGSNLQIVGVGSTTITATQAGDLDYLAATDVQQVLTVNPKTIAVTANGASKTYGAANPALTYTFSPALVNADAFTGALTRLPGENAGTYSIVQGTLGLSNNYILNFQGAGFVIQPKPVTVTANAAGKTYGQADPAFTYAIAPSLVTGDALAGSLNRAAGENAGSYPITIGSLANANYAISFVPATFTIGKANQQITWTQTLSTGCDGNTTIVLTAASGSGLPVSYSSGNVNTATVSNNVLTIVAPGTTVITASQAGNNNYHPATSLVKDFTALLTSNLVAQHWKDVLFFDNSSKQYTHWQWYKNGTLVSGSTGQYYYENGGLNGSYYAVVKTTTGSTLQTCPLLVTPGNRISRLSVFPNPALTGQNVTIKIAFAQSELQGANLTVSNIQGTILQTVQNVTPTMNIRMPLVQGIYVVRLKLSNGSSVAVNVVVQ